MSASADYMQVFDLGSFDAQAEPSFGFDRQEWTKACNELRKLRERVKASRLAQLNMSMGLTELHKTIPSREVCELLVADYMRTFGRIYRITNMPEFREQLSQFWNAPESLPKVRYFS